MNPLEPGLKKQNIIKRHRFFIAAFVVLMLYSAIPAGFKLWSVDENTFIFHTVDFSLGFCTRMLPGATQALNRARSIQRTKVEENYEF